MHEISLIKTNLVHFRAKRFRKEFKSLPQIRSGKMVVTLRLFSFFLCVRELQPLYAFFSVNCSIRCKINVLIIIDGIVELCEA